MIFITVGTHEQPFDRLLSYIDDLKRRKVISDKIIMQIGYSNYIPRFCEWKKIYPYSEMEKNISDARIVITHGGPSSFILPLRKGKIPIVVPRHINNHQLDFCKKVVKRQNNIILIEDIHDLENILINYKKIVTAMNPENRSNNKIFVLRLEKEINKLFRKE